MFGHAWMKARLCWNPQNRVLLPWSEADMQLLYNQTSSFYSLQLYSLYFQTVSGMIKHRILLTCSQFMLSNSALWCQTLCLSALPPVYAVKQWACLHMVLNPFTAVLAAPSVWKRPIKVQNLKPSRLFCPLAWAGGKISVKMHSIESGFATGPSNILSAGLMCALFSPEIWQSGAVKGLTSIETTRLIRDGKKAGKGVSRWEKRDLEYLSLHCHHHNDSCIQIGTDDSHSNFSLTARDTVRRQCPTNHKLFEDKGEPKRNRAEALLLSCLTPYRWAKPAPQSRLVT